MDAAETLDRSDPVGRPVMSVGTLMGVVFILALGLGAYQIDLANSQVYRLYHELVIGCVPMACLLTIGLLFAGADIKRRGHCSSFTFGFEAFGWASILLYAAYMAINFENGRRPIDWLTPPTAWLVGSHELFFQEHRVVAFHSMLLLAPQMLFALFGAFVAETLRLTVSRLPRD